MTKIAEEGMFIYTIRVVTTLASLICFFNLILKLHVELVGHWRYLIVNLAFSETGEDSSLLKMRRQHKTKKSI